MLVKINQHGARCKGEDVKSITKLLGKKQLTSLLKDLSASYASGCGISLLIPEVLADGGTQETEAEGGVCDSNFTDELGEENTDTFLRATVEGQGHSPPGEDEVALLFESVHTTGKLDGAVNVTLMAIGFGIVVISVVLFNIVRSHPELPVLLFLLGIGIMLGFTLRWGVGKLCFGGFQLLLTANRRPWEAPVKHTADKYREELLKNNIEIRTAGVSGGRLFEELLVDIKEN